MSVDQAAAAVYGRAIAVCRAAVDVPPGDAWAAASAVLADMDDVDELRRLAGALASLVVWSLPHRPGVPPGVLLDALAVEIAWEASP